MKAAFDLRLKPFASKVKGTDQVDTIFAALTTRSGRKGTSRGGMTQTLVPRGRETFQALGGHDRLTLDGSRPRSVSSSAPRLRPNPFKGHCPVHLVAVDGADQPGRSYVDGIGHASLLGVIAGDSSEGVITAPTPSRFSSGGLRLVLEARDHASRPIVFAENLVPRLLMVFASPSTSLSTLWTGMVAGKRRQLEMLGASDSGYAEPYC
jgi:hypothetical protein